MHIIWHWPACFYKLKSCFIEGIALRAAKSQEQTRGVQPDRPPKDQKKTPDPGGITPPPLRARLCSFKAGGMLRLKCLFFYILLKKLYNFYCN